MCRSPSAPQQQTGWPPLPPVAPQSVSTGKTSVPRGARAIIQLLEVWGFSGSLGATVALGGPFCFMDLRRDA